MSTPRRAARLRRRLRPLKRAAIPPAAWAANLLLRCSARRLGVAIVFHRVDDVGGEAATELVPAMATGLFRAELALLARRHDVVAPAQLLAAASSRRRFRRFPVAVTFDDDWSGHVRVTLPVLSEAGISAAFFLNGASLHEPHPLWFETVQSAYDRGLLGPPRAIHDEAARIQRLPAAERQALVRELRQRLGGVEGDEGLRAEDVRALARAGHEIGFHTRTHETLTTLDSDALERALRDGRAELERAAEQPLQAIAYPGGGADARVVERARAAGFARGYSTMPYAVGAQSDPLWLGRVYGSMESPARLALAIARALAAPGLAARRPQTSAAGE